MRVALVSLGSFYDHSLALDYLVAYAASVIPCENIDFRTFVDIGGLSCTELIEQVRNFRPDVVGFNTSVWNIQATREVAQSIKTGRPSTVVVFGGMEASYNVKSLLSEADGPDFIVIGEGEIPFTDLLLKLRDGHKFSATIPGLAWREGDRVQIGGMGRSLDCLDDIPSPFQVPTFAKRGLKRVLYESYRGCAFRCSFCLYHRDYARCRYFSPLRIAEDLSAIISAGATEIRFVDAAFNVNRNHAKNILKILQGCGARVCIETSAEFFDEEMISLLPGAGVTQVDIGLQSTQQEALHAVGRQWHRSDRFRRNISLLRSEPRLTLNIELIAGLPGDGLAGVRASLDEAVSMWPDHVSVYRLLGLRGSEVSNNAATLGLSFSPEPPYELLESRDFPAFALGTIDELIFANLLLLNLGIGRFALRYMVEKLGVRPSSLYDHFIAHVQSYELYSQDELRSVGKFHAYGNRFESDAPRELSFNRVDRAVTGFFSEIAKHHATVNVRQNLLDLVDFGRSLAALDEIPSDLLHRSQEANLKPTLAPWCHYKSYDQGALHELRSQGYQFGDLALEEVAVIIFFIHPQLGPAALAGDQVVLHTLECLKVGNSNFTSQVADALASLNIVF